MSSLVQDIRDNMMKILKFEEDRTDLPDSSEAGFGLQRYHGCRGESEECRMLGCGIPGG